MKMTEQASKGTIVILSSVPWHFTWQRHHDIATGLYRRGYQVIYIDPLPKRWPTLREWSRVLGRILGLKVKAGVFRQETPPGIEYILPMAVPETHQVFVLINQKWWVPRVVRLIQDIARQRPLVVISYLPTAAALGVSKNLEPDLTIYDCVWDWDHDPYGVRFLREADLVANADQVWVDSDKLLQKMQAVTDKVFQILPGCHYALFSAARRAPVVPQEQKEILCAYFGDIGKSIDIELLQKVSHRFRLRLIGPVRRPLKGFAPRTEFVGPLPYNKLPEYLSDVHVLLLPYLQAEYTKSVIPAKTFECLATGKPIVAIGLPNLSRFGKLFYLCNSEDEFLDAIVSATREPGTLREQRLKVAKQNDWDVRLEQIEALIMDGLTKKKVFSRCNG